MLTPDEYQDLPEDPERAVLQFLDIALPRVEELSEQASEKRTSAFSVWSKFAAGLLGVLEEAGIPYPSNLLPPENDEQWWGWRNRVQVFADRQRAALSFKLVRSGGAGPVEVILLAKDYKTQIRDCTRKIRGILAQATIEESLRESLLTKLGKFEFEVDRNRTRFDAALAMVVEVSEATGDAAKALEPVADLMKKILGLFGKAKRNAQLEHEKRKQLPPPETEQEDEIPF